MKDKENIRKKNQTEILEIKSYLDWIKNIVESHPDRLAQWKTVFQGWRQNRHQRKKQIYF
jgi:hypothetical protein